MSLHLLKNVNNKICLQIIHLILTYQEDLALNNLKCGGAHGVMVIIRGNGHGDTSSNPGPG